MNIMKFKARLIIFFIICFIFYQVVFTSIPLKLVYNERLKYKVVSNNVYDFEVSIKALKKYIEDNKIKHYVIILGDSVGYSSPCGDYDSIGHHMNVFAENEGYSVKFFNLSFPSEFPGDVYILLKLLEEYDISTENVIINYYYTEFTNNMNYNGVFWMKEYLRSIDPLTYERFNKGQDTVSTFKETLIRKIYTNFTPIMYKDFIREYIVQLIDSNFSGELGDTSPWYKKKDILKTYITDDIKSQYFNEEPFVLNEENPAVYFVDKTIEMRRGKNTIYYLPGMNKELLKEVGIGEAYFTNLQILDSFFMNKAINYINYNGKIDYSLYTDFVHLTPQGYKMLAKDLWERIKDDFNLTKADK